MPTSHSQWYWDGAWHPYPKGKQPISVEMLPVPSGLGEFGSLLGACLGLALRDQIEEMNQNMRTYLESRGISIIAGQLANAGQGGIDADNRTSKLHIPPQTPT